MLRSESQEERQGGRLSESEPPPPPSQAAGSVAAAPTLCGQLLYRLPSLSSALLKDWQPGFWVLRGCERLLVFESRAAYEQSKQPASSPSLLKKQVALVEGLLVGELKYKDYGGKHGRLHHFTLEARRDGATSTVTKFASEDRGALAFLHEALQARLAAAVKARIDYTVRVVGRAGSRQHIIDGVVMKERTRMAAEGASPSVAAVLAGRGAEEASAV